MQKDIIFSNVSFSWAKKGDKTAGNNRIWRLEIAALTIESGAHVFLQGPSGSGKSSFLSLLAGLISPSQGEIFIAGKPLHSASARKRDALRAEYMGFVFQQLNLISYLSVLENVLLPVYFSQQTAAKKRAAEQRASELLNRLGLEEALWTQPASELSVGQQQRVAIARALITEPAILIADEPTSALDAANRDAFIDVMLRESARLGTTVVFVSHDEALKKHFRRHLVLQRDAAGIVRCIEHEAPEHESCAAVGEL